MSTLRIAVILCCCLLGTGCWDASTNPHEGGLFGYSPEAYEQRQQERQARLAAIEQEQQTESAKSKDLESQKETKAQAVERQKKAIQAVEKDVAAARTKLSKAKAANADQEKRLAELRSRAAGLEKASNAAAAKPDSEALKAELARLTKERDQLKRDMDALLAE